MLINIKKIESNLDRNFTTWNNIFLKDFDLKNAFDLEQYNYLVHAPYYKFLSECVKKYKPKLILELGTRHGLSAISFCQNKRKECKIISVDWVKQKNFADKAILKKFLNLSFIKGNCLDLTIFKEIPFNIDLLFLDTEHTFDQVNKEFEIYKYLLSDKALVIVDDLNLNDKYKFFINFKGTKKNLTRIHCNGFGLFIYERKNKLNKNERLLRSLSNSIKALSSQNYYNFKKIENMEKSYYLLPGRKFLRMLYRILPNSFRIFINKIIN